MDFSVLIASVLAESPPILFFVSLQTAFNVLQNLVPGVPTQLFPELPFPLVILALLLVTIGNAGWLNRSLNLLPENLQKLLIRILKTLQTTPPSALGTIFKKE